MYIHLKLVKEPWPGERWQSFFDRAWPLFRIWYVSEGEDVRPDLVTCRSLLELHMPELIPVYNSLCRLVKNDDMACRFLSMWCPPPYIALSLACRLRFLQPASVLPFGERHTLA